MWWNVLCLYLDWDLPTRASYYAQHQYLKCTNVQNDYDNSKEQSNIHCWYLNMNTAERRGVWGCTSRQPRGCPKPEKSSGSREILRSEGKYVQPNNSQLEAMYRHYLIMDPSLGMHWETLTSLDIYSYCPLVLTVLQQCKQCKSVNRLIHSCIALHCM